MKRHVCKGKVGSACYSDVASYTSAGGRRIAPAIKAMITHPGAL